MTDVLTQTKPGSLPPDLSPTPVSRFFYRTFGLSFTSEIELPELATTTAPGPEGADAEIVTATCPPLIATSEELADGICVQGRTAQFLVDDVARYTIENGRRIVVERHQPDTDQPPVSEEDVRLYTLGSAMGTLLYQRNIIPLHASAVATPQGTWAFTGASGAGKSTMASWISTYWGLPLITDDVLAAHPQGDTFQLYPGPARVKLWTDALAALGMSSAGLTRDFSRADKFQMRVRGIDHGPCAPMRGLVFLERGADDEPPSLTAITGMEAFQAILSALYRPTFALRILTRKALFDHCMRLAQQIPCYRFRRRWNLSDMDASIEPLLQHIGSPSRCNHHQG